MIKRREAALKAIGTGDPKIKQWSRELLQDKDLCSEAIKLDYRALDSIPDDLISPEMCQLAVRCDPFSKRFIPNDIVEEALAALIEKNRNRQG